MTDDANPPENPGSEARADTAEHGRELTEPDKTTGSRSLEVVALAVLKLCLELDPPAHVLDGITSYDLARLAASHITACPKCGAEPWVNIDCNICDIGRWLESDRPPPKEAAVNKLDEHGQYDGELVSVACSIEARCWYAWTCLTSYEAASRKQAIAELRANLVAALAELDALEAKEPGHE